jgi:hypothetical protein
LLQAQDKGRLQCLLPIKYGRMPAFSFAFLRGSAVVMASAMAASPERLDEITDVDKITTLWVEMSGMGSSSPWPSCSSWPILTMSCVHSWFLKRLSQPGIGDAQRS